MYNTLHYIIYEDCYSGTRSFPGSHGAGRDIVLLVEIYRIAGRDIYRVPGSRGVPSEAQEELCS